MNWRACLHLTYISSSLFIPQREVRGRVILIGVSINRNCFPPFLFHFFSECPFESKFPGTAYREITLFPFQFFENDLRVVSAVSIG